MVDLAAGAGGDETADRRPSPEARPAGPNPAASERLFIGAMSGTSADGVDLALVAIAGVGIPGSNAPPDYRCRLLRHLHVGYDESLRHAVFTLRRQGGADLRTLARVARDVSQRYAAGVHQLLQSADLSADQIAAVAAHGQTVFHEPPCTIQLLDPSLLAGDTSCVVTSDFRRADCAVGGQGAPLVPFADYILFRHPTRSRVLLNIGGIANVTYLRADGKPDEVVAFDTGPGNCVSDHLMRLHDPTGPGYDRNGELAAGGQAIDPLLHRMLDDPYFAGGPPKSTDGPAMISLFAQAHESIGRNCPVEDLLRTACLLSATTIADSIRRFRPFPDELIVSGGGTRNATLMSLLRQSLGDLPISTTDDVGVPSEAKEAVAFALLGAATLDGVPGNVPSATGARRAVVLGSITPKP